VEKSKKTPATDLKDVPFLAVEVFRDHPSPFASLTAPAVGKKERPFTAEELSFRKSHVAIEKVRRAPTPTALLTLLRGLLPDLKVSPLQTTIQMAWAEVLLREAKDRERFDLRGVEMDRVTLAAVFLRAAAPLRATPPFRWVLPYLESLLAAAAPDGTPAIARERAAAALEAAQAAGEPLALRMALTRVRDTYEGPPHRRPGSRPPHLTFRKDDQCILVGGTAVSLTPREFTLLWTTAEGGTLSRARGVELLAKERSVSGAGIPGAVEEEALRAHRRSILGKVEKAAGRAFRDRLGKAFRTEKRVFVYDEAVLPFTVE